MTDNEYELGEGEGRFGREQMKFCMENHAKSIVKQSLRSDIFSGLIIAEKSRE